MCPCVQDRIGFWNCWFLRRGGKRSTRRKTSWSKGENQQQTQPTYGVDAGIWIQRRVLSPLRHRCLFLIFFVFNATGGENERSSSYCRVARQGLSCYTAGSCSSTTWFQTSRYGGAKVQFYLVNLVRHGSSTTFETGLRHLQNATPVQSSGSRALQECVSGCVCVDCDLRFSHNHRDRGFAIFLVQVWVL